MHLHVSHMSTHVALDHRTCPARTRLSIHWKVGGGVWGGKYGLKKCNYKQTPWNEKRDKIIEFLPPLDWSHFKALPGIHFHMVNGKFHLCLSPYENFQNWFQLIKIVFEIVLEIITNKNVQIPIKWLTSLY